MSDGNAIQFSIGADNRGLLEVLADSERAAKKSASTVGDHLRDMAKGPGKGASSDGRTFEDYFSASERRIHGTLLNISKDFMQTGLSVDNLSEGAIRLSEIFKTGLGLGLVVGGLALFTKHMGDTIEKTEELEKKLREVRKETIGTGSNFQSAQELSSNLAEASAQADAMRDAQFEDLRGRSFSGFLGGFAHNIGVGAQGIDERLGAFMSGDDRVAYSTVTDNLKRRLEQAEASEARAREKVAEKEARIADMGDIGFKRSVYVANQEKLRIARDERLGAAEGNLGLGEAIKREFETSMGSLARQEQARQRGYFYGITGAAMQSSRTGDMGVNLAQNALNAAQSELKDAGDRTEEKEAAQLKVRNAQLALDAAKRTSEETHIQLASEQRLADLRASSSNEELAALTESVKKAQLLLGVYKDATEQQQRQVDLSKAQQALADYQLAKQDEMRGLLSQKDVLSAQGNHASAVQLAQLKLEQAQQELYMRGGRSPEDNQAAQNAVDAAQNELKFAKEIHDEQQKRDEDARSSLELRLAGETRLADILDRQSRYESEARAAERAGDKDRAERIREMGRLEQEQSDFNSAYDASHGRLYSDHDRMRAGQLERYNARRQGNALSRFQRQGGLVDPHYDSDGNLLSGVDPHTGQRRPPTSDERSMIDQRHAQDMLDRYKRAGAAEKLRLDHDPAYKHARDTVNKAESDAAAKAKKDEDNKKSSQDRQKDSEKNMTNIEKHLAKVSSILAAWDK